MPFSPFPAVDNKDMDPWKDSFLMSDCNPFPTETLKGNPNNPVLELASSVRDFSGAQLNYR